MKRTAKKKPTPRAVRQLVIGAEDFRFAMELFQKAEESRTALLASYVNGNIAATTALLQSLGAIKSALEAIAIGVAKREGGR